MPSLTYASTTPTHPLHAAPHALFSVAARPAGWATSDSQSQVPCGTVAVAPSNVHDYTRTFGCERICVASDSRTRIIVSTPASFCTAYQIHRRSSFEIVTHSFPAAWHGLPAAALTDPRHSASPFSPTLLVLGRLSPFRPAAKATSQSSFFSCIAVASLVAPIVPTLRGMFSLGQTRAYAPAASLRWIRAVAGFTRARPSINCCHKEGDVQLLLQTSTCVLQRVPGHIQVEDVRGLAQEEWREYWLIEPASGSPLRASRDRPAGNDALRCLVRMLGGASTARRAQSDLDGSNPVGTRLLLSDDLVDIWEFRLQPGESCAFHTHIRPYFFTNIGTSDTIELDHLGARVGEASRQVRGQTIFVPKERLGSHGVVNVGQSTFLQFIVEFKVSEIDGTASN